MGFLSGPSWACLAVRSRRSKRRLAPEPHFFKAAPQRTHLYFLRSPFLAADMQPARLRVSCLPHIMAIHKKGGTAVETTISLACEARLLHFDSARIHWNIWKLIGLDLEPSVRASLDGFFQSPRNLYVRHFRCSPKARTLHEPSNSSAV